MLFSSLFDVKHKMHWDIDLLRLSWYPAKKGWSRTCSIVARSETSGWIRLRIMCWFRYNGTSFKYSCSFSFAKMSVRFASCDPILEKVLFVTAEASFRMPKSKPCCLYHLIKLAMSFNFWYFEPSFWRLQNYQNRVATHSMRSPGVTYHHYVLIPCLISKFSPSRSNCKWHM